MSLGKHAPIEPLSEPQWEEIEAAVFAELDAEEGIVEAPAKPGYLTGRWGVIAAMSAACVLGLGLMTALWPDDAPMQAPHATSFAGGPEGSRLMLGEVTLDMGASSEGVAMGSDAQGWVIALHYGRVTFSVPPRVGRPPFAVRAGDARVEVVGTRFTVERDGRDVEVEVAEGHVRVTCEQEAVELGPQEHWARDTGSAPSAAVTSAPATTVAAVEVAAEATAATPEEQATSRPAPPASRTPEQHVARSGPSSSAQDLFERATALESQDPAQAIDLYAAAARRRSPWRAAALYAQGRLELERGHDAAGRRLLRRYLRGFPQGVNAADARTLLTQAASGRPATR